MKDLDGILNRLYECLSIKNDTEFCKRYDIKPNTLSTWKKREKIPYELIMDISQNENIPIDYILLGVPQEQNQDNDTNICSDVVSINFYDDIFASAGYGNHAYENQPAVLEFDKSFLENILNIKKFDRLDIIRVVGDSMLPSIKDGEYIIVERDSEARNGDTVIANIDGELYVKRLNKIPLSPYIILESENENYRPIELDTDEKLQMCNILGVVRCKIKLY